MNVRNSNSNTLKLQRKISFQVESFPVLNAFTPGTEEYYPRCYKVNDVKHLQKIILCLEAANHAYWLN